MWGWLAPALGPEPPGGGLIGSPITNDRVGATTHIFKRPVIRPVTEYLQSVIRPVTEYLHRRRGRFRSNLRLILNRDGANRGAPWSVVSIKTCIGARIDTPDPGAVAAVHGHSPSHPRVRQISPIRGMPAHVLQEIVARHRVVARRPPPRELVNAHCKRGSRLLPCQSLATSVTFFSE